MAYAPRPKAGVFAVRQAPYLLDNLRTALIGSGTMRHYQPQRDYLKLISTGGKGAVADKFGLRLDGAWLWRWKDQIDQKFMAKFASYPAMPKPALPIVSAKGMAAGAGRQTALRWLRGQGGGGRLCRSALAALPRPTRPMWSAAPAMMPPFCAMARGFR